ncbi:oligopeptide transporter, OPT family [Pseudoluteimonas lycopersici]|uniref:Oligopeptide transporter, OPT family n=1 Tax=Pseudoluteimonas lycopersici TaxID=1324796 RepID=A0A516V4H2_9GAMM|nr:oligopeptide transporter, OPT family [Lysobacter lycopersici]QDQ73435.1 oligopeptide transporter, OPT family [Lysobacter lycopersici]
MNEQHRPVAEPRTELTWRGLALGVVITVAFTAANVFFGLKAGLTFATSIPAAVISMALLRAFKDSTIQENNIVQTVASAAGTLSSIIFVLPGLVMIGWWTGFPFWESFLICLLGGVLGVMYSIPLRRALVTGSDLPYPEGVACAEVLKVGSGDDASGVEESKAGLRVVVWGSIVSAVFAVIVATKVFAASVTSYFKVNDRGAMSGFDLALSMALFAVGHLVGFWVGVAMLLGALIAWAWGVPHYTSELFSHLDASAQAAALANPAAFVDGPYHDKVRLIGAGAIGLAAIWSLLKLVKPVIGGLSSAFAASKARKGGNLHMLPRTEHDIPIGVVGAISLISFVPIAWLFGHLANSSGLGAQLWPLVIGGLLYCVVMSFLVSAVCGYMAGLIGSSNSPLSGIGILVVIGAALLLLAIKPMLGPGHEKGLIAFALFVTAVVFNVAAIANNNLQDLKTGQLVDATPSKQQWALLVGVLAGAAVIPPVLELINKAYGFAGVPGVDPTKALPAPQAGLISTLAQGVIQNNIDWSLIEIGAGIGVVLIVLDVVLRKATNDKAHLSPLAVGLGIYLPTSAVLMVVVGALVGAWYDKRAERSAKPETTKQLGVLLASGMIVGEGLVGVVIAGIVAFNLFDMTLVGDAFASGPAVWIGGVAFVVAIFLLYRWVEGQARRASA